MSLLYDVALATFRRDWDALDRLVVMNQPSLDVARARSVAQGEALDGLAAPDPITIHDAGGEELQAFRSTPQELAKRGVTWRPH
jgi:hypothetical protein